MARLNLMPDIDEEDWDEEDWIEFWCRKRLLAQHLLSIVEDNWHPELYDAMRTTLIAEVHSAECQLLLLEIDRDRWDDRENWFGNDGIDCCTERRIAA